MFIRRIIPTSCGRFTRTSSRNRRPSSRKCGPWYVCFFFYADEPTTRCCCALLIRKSAIIKNDHFCFNKVLSGFDTIGIAQTGTGKTLAFLLPAFLHIEGSFDARFFPSVHHFEIPLVLSGGRVGLWGVGEQW